MRTDADDLARVSDTTLEPLLNHATSRFVQRPVGSVTCSGKSSPSSALKMSIEALSKLVPELTNTTNVAESSAEIAHRDDAGADDAAVVPVHVLRVHHAEAVAVVDVHSGELPSLQPLRLELGESNVPLVTSATQRTGSLAVDVITPTPPTPTRG